MATRVHNIRRHWFPTTEELNADLTQTQEEIKSLLLEFASISNDTHRDCTRRMWMITFTILPERYNRFRMLKEKLGEPIS
ncbi:MAG TPA: hypothetical protein PLF31_00160 [Candidatus Paceibacterota bacterium]|nr:hypothetical protein [Candidatus Paceibacterota bacterium]